MKPTRIRHPRVLTAVTITVSVLLLVLIAFLIYASDYYKAEDCAFSVLSQSNAAVSVTVLPDGNIAFVPERPVAGLVFYPGGKVEHTAYAPLMMSLAQRGILCVLVKMPFRLAVLDVSAADGIPEQFPQVTDWYIGGHSLGGSMAASYVSKHPDRYRGLLLLASYSATDLSESGLRVLTVYGSEDGVLNLDKLETYRSYLPPSATETEIDGGCHAGFGRYGAQKGDGSPTISPDEQIDRTAALISDFIIDAPQVADRTE